MEDLTRTQSVDELNSLGFSDILEQDSRPTFVIDLDPDKYGADAILPIFCNAALRTHEPLLDAVLGLASGIDNLEADAVPHDEFREWVTGWSKFDDSRDVFPLTFIYSGILWTGSTVKKRWRLISGNLFYQISQATTQDLSAGPPSEVATGVTRKNQGPSRAEGGSLNAYPDRRDRGGTRGSKTEHTTSRALATSPTRPSLAKMKKPRKDSSSASTGATNESTSSIQLFAPEKAISDWTAKKPSSALTPHLRFARSIEWSATPLGPMESWSKEFRQIANLVMSNPHPAALFWGNDLTLFYNETYAVEVAGTKHPGMMGTGFSGPFSALWEGVSPIFAECARTGISVRKENQFLPMERSGYLEETFFSWSITPLYGGTSQILGFYNAPFETTAYCVGTRRMETLRRLGIATSLAQTTKSFYEGVLDSLEDNHFDIPFALLYSVVDGDGDEESTHSSGSMISLKSCMLEGSIAIPEGHPAAPQKLDLKRSLEGFVPSFREAMRTREPTKLQTRDGTLPESLLEGIEWRGHGIPCQEAIIFPIRPTNGESVLAFLLLGVNPMRAYDDEYKAYTTMLNRQLATSLASVMLFEEEMHRSKYAAQAAAAQQEQLTQQLAIQTSRLKRMAELSPLGMYYIAPDGKMIEANDRWYEMTGHARDNMDMRYAWLDDIEESSIAMAKESWRALTEDKVPWSGELQFKAVTQDPLTPEPIDYWVMSTAQPELAEDGSLMSIMGSITDISHLKWAQGLQNRRLQEAEETRRQQNEFIDITSHEMRNPLSAILQCSDDISSSLEEFQNSKKPPTPTVVESCIEAANTIALCVQHQKSIVDDILTISKLDSNLLLIAPSPVQPVTIVMRTLKIFEPELQAKNIKITFAQDRSLGELDINWVTLDPSRLLQILINLMTNAIKFTADSPGKREITIHIGACIGPPKVQTHDFEYVPMRNPSANITLGDDWGTGDIIHLHFKVEDTGCGLKPEEKQVLFQRFSQASPRTHVVYGGSGLGLFISRRLAELHGGQIGVASSAGVGSTFGFFIKARRTQSPAGSAAEGWPIVDMDHNRAANINNMVAEAREEAASPYLRASSDHEKRPSLMAASSKPTAKLDLTTLHVLVVEDNLVNQKVLVKQLVKAGCTVAAANNGVEALAHLAGTEFQVGAGGKKLSVILMDLEMPEMDGLTCVRMIREMEARGEVSGHVAVIAVTANVREEQILEARAAGMDDVVRKPFRIGEMLAKVEALLDGKIAESWQSAGAVGATAAVVSDVVEADPGERTIVRPAYADAAHSESEYPFPSLDELALQTPLITREGSFDDGEGMAGPARSGNREVDLNVDGGMLIDMDTGYSHTGDGKKREHSLAGNLTPDSVRHRSKKQN